ncbi:MAG: helix-turn-helix domain-containing protein [Actinomycetota bacterium]
MGNVEERVRREAVTRVLAGEPAGKVAADLGRSDRWVRKWVARYDPKDDSWAHDRSRAPITQARQTPEETERMVLEIRGRLMDDPWSQVGAVAIAWEMQKLGVTSPERWTIERILARAQVAKRRARNRYVAKGTPYPSGPLLIKPNALHEIDLVGPRHLEGGVPFYALNAVDLGRRRAAIEIIKSKEEWEVAGALVSLWRRLGVPTRARFDNGLTLQGRGRHLAVPVWTCLALGARVQFIPFGEPWRNPVVEHFNDTFDKNFFRTERFTNVAHLKRRARTFERFHNSHHRYSVLKGMAPDQWERKLHFITRFPDSGFEPPSALPRRGLIEFVRLIRSDRVLKVLDAKIEMPQVLVHRYVTATLHVRTQRLVVEAEGYAWHRELDFALKF